jgi:hypothetical protein
MRRFIYEWVVNIIYLAGSLLLLGSIESALGVFNKDESNIFLVILFFLANFLIIYIFYRNVFSKKIFPYKYSVTTSISKNKVRILLSLSLIVLLVLTIIQHV